ncbi:MAG: ABC transporter permease [Verrucomicrobia bacterium]|nr:ABC transporter permease [Verrucomicrobiota bacterium]MBS0645385.1 ABC transporter permease [Verrucomicrobiota bacterium]
MTNYLFRRLCLLPLTLFAIILVNFVILNLVPGDPVTVTDRSQTGDATRSAQLEGGGEENQHLLFREHYGLTLPILMNVWWKTSSEYVHRTLSQLLTRKTQSGEEIPVQDYYALRTLMGDKARFVMPILLDFAQNPLQPLNLRVLATHFLIRGGTQQGYVGPTLSAMQKTRNKEISENNAKLISWRITLTDTDEQMEHKIQLLSQWYAQNKDRFELSSWGKTRTLFLETRFARYLSRVLFLDFGTLRNDNNKTVISEVTKRLKYSLTLAVIPMLVTFALCQVFGMMMAVQHNRWPDLSLNIIFLILFAIPVFVVAPFLIEKIALHHHVPFTQTPIPLRGFHSPDHVYNTLTSSQKLSDILLHIFLPLIAIMYGTLAVQARLSRTAFLEVLKQDYVRTAHAKGLATKTILINYVGRNGAITIITSLAASLGVVLGGSLIVETVFEINGFGRFFYEAILNRDYNVVLFSAFAGSALTLVGYLLADLAYVALDPRISLE